MKTGFWPSFRNPSLLAFNSSLSAGFNYENRFNIGQLGTRTAALTIPSGKASLGALYSHFGYSGFSRSMTALACGLKFGEKMSAGIQLDYFLEKTSGEYENHHSITFEAGLFFKPADNVSAAIHLFNPLPDSWRRSAMPAAIRAGAGIGLSRVLFAGAEAEMSTGGILIFRTGFEYEVKERLWLRAGFSSEGTSFTFGLGYLFKSVKIDLGFASHEKLGITSSASIIFKIK
ncbi:MAG: hypothetical protein MUE74_04830 [Bacteroidales bacterium]|jgi:hypothetical protein|nr:hypothetical protein [Bacteroidales bacterium]